MRRVLYAPPGHPGGEVTLEAEIARAIRGGGGCLWVDFESPTEDDRRALRALFDFHRLALEDCFSRTHHPRLHDYGDYAYLVVHAIAEPVTAAQAGGRQGVRTEEIDVFLGSHYLVTWHERSVGAIATVRRRAIEIASSLERGPDRVLAEILDEIAEGYAGVVERLNTSVDVLETRLFQRKGAQTLREVFAMKKDVVQLRRICGPQREVLNRLARGEFAYVSREDALYFRDVYDRIYRTSDVLDSLRDVLTSALEVYLTITANRTNEVMRVLTVFSIVLMSASLVAGIYGMNVMLPLVETRADFLLVLGFMGAVGLALATWFRKRRWI